MGAGVDVRMRRIGPPSAASVSPGGKNRRFARGGIEQLERIARDIVDLEGAIGGGGGGAFHLVNDHRVTVRKVVFILRGYRDRFVTIIADFFDILEIGIPVVYGRLRARIWEPVDFHRTKRRLDTPFMGIFQASLATDTQLKLRLPLRADIRLVVIQGKTVAREAQL